MMAIATSRLPRRDSMKHLTLYDLDNFPDTKQSMKVSTNEHFDGSRKKNRSQEEILSSQSKSYLEQLPNEILIYTFKQLSTADLHRSFWNLNNRLNGIIFVQKMFVDLSCPKRIFDYYCHQSILSTFSSRIFSLKLSDTYDRIKKFNSIEILSNLRSLTVRDISTESLDIILSKLPSFRSLSYLNIYSANLQSTTNVFSLSSLKTLILFSLNSPIILPNDIQITNNVEYLNIDGCYVNDVVQGMICFVIRI
ncbi:unnamed protein product [Didymodactylos carnosus]|uniref:F-box domain-containing protein n=1 Tax=Didymodactylos carnosus TaxID=1234261 RepID=A0A8S2S6W9_9BILA|nr:unnamed protein product [Didymodactylos carnosus]CAF4209247.1 unnamed protein product [Didymodactylos carnosus]